MYIGVSINLLPLIWSNGVSGVIAATHITLFDFYLSLPSY